MPIGYPDYARTASQSGNSLGGFLAAKGTDPSTGLVDCIGYGYLDVCMDDGASANHYEVVITFYLERGLINVVTTQSVLPVPGRKQVFHVPIVTRYCTVTVSHIVANDPDLVACNVFGSNVQDNQFSYTQQGVPFVTISQSIAAAGNTNVDAVFTYGGPAMLAVTTSSGSAWFAQIMYYSLASASLQILVQVNGATQGQSFFGPVNLPSCPVRLVVANTDTVARTLNASVVLG